MFASRIAKVAVISSSVLVGVSTLALTMGLAFGGTGPGASGNTITNALQAQTPFSPGTLDSGQKVDVVVPANTVLTPGASIFILECAAPGGVNPTTINSCDGNTGYAGGTVTVNSDGSIDVMNGSTPLGDPYVIYALPDSIQLLESPSSPTHCGLGSANECVLYIGQGGGSDTGLSQPHFFSQAFQVHPDPTDSGTLSPGDGTFPADSAPSITSANHVSFNEGSAGTFTVTATGWPPPKLGESGTLPTGVGFNTSTGVLSGTPTQSGTFPITFSATNGVGSPASQPFTLTVNTSGVAPAITSANHVTFTQGSAGTFTVTATGTPTPTLGESGTLPTGVGFNTSTGVLSGTPTQSGTFPITFSATNGVGSPASQPFTLTVNTSGVGPSITLLRTSGLVGNESVVVSGSGWGIDSSILVAECTTTTMNPSSCGSPIPALGASSAAAGRAGGPTTTGGFTHVRITLHVGVVGKGKHTCGLATSGPCFIVAAGNTGDSANSGPLVFSVPSFVLRRTTNVTGGTTDKLHASGFPMGDNVVAAECDAHVRVPKTVTTHCDSSTAVTGIASRRGRVAFNPDAITILVGSAFSDPAHRQCQPGGTCEIVVVDTDNPSIALETPITLAAPAASPGRASSG